MKTIAIVAALIAALWGYLSFMGAVEALLPRNLQWAILIVVAGWMWVDNNQ